MPPLKKIDFDKTITGAHTKQKREKSTVVRAGSEKPMQLLLPWRTQKRTTSLTAGLGQQLETGERATEIKNLQNLTTFCHAPNEQAVPMG